MINNEWEKPGDPLYEFNIERVFQIQPMMMVKDDTNCTAAHWSPENGWYSNLRTDRRYSR